MTKNRINFPFLLALGIVISCLSSCTPLNTNTSSTVTFEEQYLEPEWVPLIAGSSISYDKNYKYHPSEMKLNNEMLLREESWEDYLKNYIESFPLESRHKILNGITRHWHGYDKIERFIRFEPLRYISGPYSSTSYIALTGVLHKNEAAGFLKIRFYGNTWLFVESVKVLTGNTTYQSPKLEVKRDNHRSVWEDAYLPISNPEYRNLLERIINTDETIIRFQGRQYYSDFTVTDRMKTDLKAMLITIDTINGK